MKFLIFIFLPFGLLSSCYNRGIKFKMAVKNNTSTEIQLAFREKKGKKFRVKKTEITAGQSKKIGLVFMQYNSYGYDINIDSLKIIIGTDTLRYNKKEDIQDSMGVHKFTLNINPIR